MKATWNGVTVADSDKTVVVDGNHYFPENSLVREHFAPSETTSVCGWKGTANYFHVVAGGSENKDAAWYYAAPKEAAAEIKGYVAFWKGVEVSS